MCRFHQIELNRQFSTHHQSPVLLYFLSPSSMMNLYSSREKIHVDLIESSRIGNIFNPPSKPIYAIFFKSNANGLLV